MNRYDIIHANWFNHVDDDTLIRKKVMPFKKWFLANRATDLEIQQKFEGDIVRAAAGDYQSWEKTPLGSLSLILLLDQFPRNVYRHTPKMFAFDPQALDVASRCVQTGMDKDLNLIERIFMYMPFMHSERLEDQRKSVEYFTTLVPACQERNPINISYYESTLLYAQRHREIIERFGRFPHRNEWLNRTSTSKEKDFLIEKGHSF